MIRGANPAELNWPKSSSVWWKASERRTKGGTEREGLIGNCRVWKVNRMCLI